MTKKDILVTDILIFTIKTITHTYLIYGYQLLKQTLHLFFGYFLLKNLFKIIPGLK